MQKLLKRVKTAEKVVAKRVKRRQRQFAKLDKEDETSHFKDALLQVSHDIKRAKQAIRDDWHLGPLAPNPSTGDHADTHGCITHARFKSPLKLKDYQREDRCKWIGSSKHISLAAGDRVVLLEGPDKGRIGSIQSVDEESCEVVVSNLNKSNIVVPSFMRTKDNPSAVAMELSIPIPGVRLVHPIQQKVPKAEGGQEGEGEAEAGPKWRTRDVIINQLAVKNIVYDDRTGKVRWDRVVPGLNISIPWPKKERPEYKDYEADTLRIDVEDKTFVPTLLSPPMPASVIDELRGRYSRFRTRHEPEYIARKEAEEQAKKDRVKLMDNMRTPLQEFHRAEREKKKKKGKPRLTLEMLEEIGKVIARNQELRMNAANGTGPPPEAGGVPPAGDDSGAADALESLVAVVEKIDGPSPDPGPKAPIRTGSQEAAATAAVETPPIHEASTTPTTPPS